MEHTWVHTTSYAPLPIYAIVGGHDCDGSPIYVGRSYHEGENLPAKVIPSKGCAYVSYDGLEHRKIHFEVLVGPIIKYLWSHSRSVGVPPNAVRSGTTRAGEPLYVGRAYYSNSLVVGKVHISHGCLYVPFGGREITCKVYEVLIYEENSTLSSSPQKHNWVHTTSYAPLPLNAVRGGHDVDGSPIYVGRAYHQYDCIPAKVIPSKGCAFVSYSGKEYIKYNYDVLVGNGYTWIPSSGGAVPPNAVSSGKTGAGEALYVGRTYYDKSLVVGKVHPSHGRFYFPFNKKERSSNVYEALVYDIMQSVAQVPSHNMTSALLED